jgi:hypothetical protein
MDQKNMKELSVSLEVPLYDGDSLIRYGPGTDSAPAASRKQADFTPNIPQRSKTPEATMMSALDIAEIEARARALRAAAIADLVGRGWTWLGGYFERARRRRDEEYLARSQNLADLEHRLRKLERQGQLLHV